MERKPSGGKLRSDIVRRKLYATERSKEGGNFENEAITQLRELVSRAKSFGQLSTLLLAYLHEKFNETLNSWLICQLQTIAFDLDLSMGQVRDIIEIFDALQVVEFTKTSIIYRHAPRCNIFFCHLYDWVKGYLEKTSENSIVEAYFNAHDRSCGSINGKLTIQFLLILLSSQEFQHLDAIVSQLLIEEVNGVTMRERTRRISNIAAVLAQNGAVSVDGKRLKFNYEIVQSEEYPCFDPIPSDILYVAANDAQVYRTRRHGGSLQLNHVRVHRPAPAPKKPINFDLLESPIYISQCDVMEILNSSECAQKANASNEVPDVTCHETFTPSPAMSFPKVKYEEMEDFDEWIDGQGMFSTSAWTLDALLNDQVDIFHV